MDEFFASKPATNNSYLCVGPLTRDEGADAASDGIGNGLGYYIYVAELQIHAVQLKSWAASLMETRPESCATY